MTINEHLHRAREHARAQRVPGETLTAGQRAADAIAALVGSWRFVIVQTALLVAWLVYNATAARPLDPFPFILLNLLL
jgi:uncharacterized membrane protein